MYQRTAWTTVLVGAALIAGLAVGPARASGVPAPAQGHGTASVLTGPNCERSPATPPLKPGDTGRAVRELQCLLAYCGYYTGPIDGYYGSALGQALLHYQRDHGLPVDGVVGPRVWALLRAGVC
ncbi:peptidoglycan-binding protein [Streptomyces sp. CBMA152]|uniref:peptidoglycan-binding domain-containing protein n=1 Tax=Streptomyces sp. CBMA152 TaxID=1896312 RepID=UPI00166165F5|nr:peptidoglycan-binding domain-containing protein [Streptomyces sp. CBMA152]MBD0746661.1 hypothetical protein [Streptomyces sp. CBMA152]